MTEYVSNLGNSSLWRRKSQHHHSFWVKGVWFHFSSCFCCHFASMYEYVTYYNQ